MLDLIELTNLANSEMSYARTPQSTAVLLTSGIDDPVGDYGSGVRQVFNKYVKNGLKTYMHFYDNELNLLYLYPSKNNLMCVYNIPNDILDGKLGKTMYLDYINLINMYEISEYAIESSEIRFEYLDKVYMVNDVMSFDCVPKLDEFYSYMNILYDREELKLKMEGILSSGDGVSKIYDNLGCFVTLIPEIKCMIGFDHKHPHHHLDVFNHTLEVIKKLDSDDFELNMAALLHDIGKPHSYQEGEVRHYNGHQNVSYNMSIKILESLGYDKEFIDRVTYLVKTHDSLINPSKLDNNYEMIAKRLRLQYADAMAHHPDKVEKRLKILDGVKDTLYNICPTEIDDIFSVRFVKKKIKKVDNDNKNMI
jgi:putative nucleotidyltransferase with HDIG domain